MKRFYLKSYIDILRCSRQAREVNSLFAHYEQFPLHLPQDFRAEDDLHRRISHYIAGMTDRFASKEFQKLVTT
jgi:dGTPase